MNSFSYGWIGIASLLVVLEMVTGTFYLLMLAIGAFAGAVVSLIGLPESAQQLSALVVGVGAVLILRFSRKVRVRVPASRDSNVNLDIGQRLSIGAWERRDGVVWVSSVTYRGAEWAVEYAGEGDPKSGSFTVVEVRGIVLIVK